MLNSWHSIAFSEEYKYAGQNLAWKWFSMGFGHMEDTIQGLTMCWYNEYEFAVMDNIHVSGGGPKPKYVFALD